MDDVRVYNSLLTVSQIEDVRWSAITAVPESRDFALAVVGLLGVLIFIRSRRAQA